MGIQEAASVIFLDLTKAFHRLDRETLLNKLKNLNISDTALQWIASYLTDREDIQFK